METSRNIQKEELKEIISKFQSSNTELLESIRKMIRDFDNLIDLGEKYIYKRNNYYCGELELEYKILSDKEYFNKDNFYLKSEMTKNRYFKCLNLSNNSFTENHKTIIKYIQNLKMNQKNQLNKCIVFKFEADEMQKCLIEKMLRKEKKIHKLIKDYHYELTNFSKNIYI
jgi:hypothetical protein